MTKENKLRTLFSEFFYMFNAYYGGEILQGEINHLKP